MAGYKNFVSRIDHVKIDKTSHGTRSVRLVLQVFREATVFVALVFDSGSHSKSKLLSALAASLTHVA